MRFNGFMVRGCRLRVCRARFGKGGFRVNVEDVSKQKVKMLARKRWGAKSPKAG